MKTLRYDESSEFGRLLVSLHDPSVMPKHEKEFQFFRFKELPFADGKCRSISSLGTTDILSAAVQILGDGGETKMHAHAAMDGFWMVLQGRAVFWGEDKVEHEFGPLEGIIVPRGVPYAFKKIGDQPLMILQVEGLHARAKHNTYVPYYEETKRETNPDSWIDIYDAKAPT